MREDKLFSFVVLCMIAIGYSVAADWCYDTDRGDNPYTYGIATHSSKGSYMDNCLNGSILMEFYCYPVMSDWRLDCNYHTCLLGCLEGKCIQQSQIFTIHLHEGWNLISVPLGVT